MKILILDPYPVRPWRISKDTIGGYGTANRFGDGVVARILTWAVARDVDWPPLYAVACAGVLIAQGNDVEYSRNFCPENSYDLCVITSSIVSHETELKAVKKVVKTGMPVLVVGPFATSLPKPYVDAGAAVIAGEPEMYFFNNPLDKGKLKKVRGIQASGKSVELDELPLPAWELVFGSHKPKFRLLGAGNVMLPIVATRGCPYSCSHYCVYPLQQGRKVRVRSPDKIVEEMEHWADLLGINFFIFRDPVFSINRKHTIELCKALEKSNHKFRFVIETHLNNLDEELATRLRRLGLEMVKIGVESISPKAIKESKRFAVAREEQEQKIKMLERMGIKVTCFYILGMPGDTEETFWATMKYARKLNTVFTQISVFTPYPGTPAFKQFDKDILVDNYESFTQYDLVVRHENFTPERVRKMLSRAYSIYYLRPKWIYKYLVARFV